jgi:hypothetical protein
VKLLGLRGAVAVVALETINVTREKLKHDVSTNGETKRKHFYSICSNVRGKAKTTWRVDGWRRMKIILMTYILPLCCDLVIILSLSYGCISMAAGNWPSIWPLWAYYSVTASGWLKRKR